MFALRRSVFAIAYLLVLFVAFARGALATELVDIRPHLTVNIGSYHLNASQDFNEVNPGLGVGLTFGIANPNIELDIEIGQYRNSLSDNSVYIMGAWDTQIAKLSPNLTWRAGSFIGVSHYPGDSSRLKGNGVPTFGNWVMGGGLQTSLRLNDDTDLRMRIMPAGKIADALFTLQAARYF